MALSAGLCISTLERYRSSNSRQPIFFRRISVASSFAERNGVASIGGALLRPAHVDVDLFNRQQTVLVCVGGFEVLEEGVDVLLHRKLAVALAVGGLDGLRRRFLQLFDGQVAGLVLVPEEEGLDRGILELSPVDLAIAVLIVLLDPGLGVRRRPRLRGRRAVQQEQLQHRNNREVAEWDAHGQPCTLQLPSGWRQALPYAFSILPPMFTSLWNSRQ